MKLTTIARRAAVAASLLLGANACADSPNDPATSAAADSEGRSSLRFMQLGETLTWAPFLVARGTGCFEDAGVDVEWTIGPSNGQQATLAVAQGEADVVGVGTGGFLAAVDAGRPLVAFGAGAKGDTSFVVLRDDVVARLETELGVVPDSPVEDRMDALQGLRIGANTAGGPIYQSTVAALNDFGLDESDVQLQAIGDPAAMAAAMRAGQLDGAVFSQPLTAGEGNQVWIDGPSGDVPSWTEGYYWVYVTTRSFAEQHAEALGAVYGCVDEASTLIADDPATAAEAARELLPGLDDADYATSFEALAPAFVDGPSTSEEGHQQSVERYNASADSPVDIAYSDAFVTIP